jgi:bifunctional non-homologous end joining protein LigD
MNYSSEDGWKLVLSQEVQNREIRSFEGKAIELTDANKELWKGVTKEDVMKYYQTIAPTILPYLKDRPLGLNVSIYGVDQDGVFIRGMENNYPPWATIFKTERKNPKAGKSTHIDWLVCNDIATMMYMVNLGCIDFHPWNSRVNSPNNPDYIVIDLDPSDEDFSKVIETTLAAKQFLDANNIIGFVKTSGQTGIHIFLPCEGIEYGNARKIGETIAKEIHQLVPDITTIAALKKNRGNKLYIDPSQNDFADRMAVAYCLRSFKQLQISTPLEWREINNELNPANFSIEIVLDRLKRKGDLWSDLQSKKNMLNNVEALKPFLL